MCARGSGCIPSPCLDADLASTLHAQRVASTGAVPKEGAVSMGRRVLIVMGFVLILAGYDARGQDQKTAGTREQDSGLAPFPPVTPAPGLENGNDAPLPPPAPPASAGALPPLNETPTVASQLPATNEPEPTQSPVPPAGKKPKRVSPGLLDTQVRPAQTAPRRQRPSPHSRPRCRGIRHTEMEPPKGLVSCFPRTGFPWASKRSCSAWTCRRRRTSFITAPLPSRSSSRTAARPMPRESWSVTNCPPVWTSSAASRRLNESVIRT